MSPVCMAACTFRCMACLSLQHCSCSNSKVVRCVRQIYEVALYLEVDSTTAELKRLRDAGFFAQARPLLLRTCRLSASC